MTTKPYIVNAGAVLAHDGQDRLSGSVVDLPPHVAHEVRHLVTPLDPVTRQPVSWGPAEHAALEAELARARPHERVSLIEAAIAQHGADGAHLQQLLAAARRDEAASASAVRLPARGPDTTRAAAPSKPASRAKDDGPKDGK